ncbi:hypothetical protein B0H14DRAFT_2608912 [Mycena olivaceomarginata]|nr:hypothetical protein B0H14DRAFT_2608912 [Mycena olivaceomarginata]
MSTDPFLTMTTDSDLAACASSSDHEIRYQRALREYRMPRRYSAQETSSWRGACGMTWRRLNASARAEAVQAQRDKWKAASARYYLKHPEIKEKKRVKMAEKKVGQLVTSTASVGSTQSGALIVGRKPDGEGQLGDFSGTPDLDLDVEDGGTAKALRDLLGISKDGHDTADTVAAASLLFLRTHQPPQRQSSRCFRRRVEQLSSGLSEQRRVIYCE